MAWIKVTDPQGHPVYLSIEQLVRIRPSLPGIDFPAPAPEDKMQRDRKNGDMTSTRSIVDLVTGVQAVQETQDEIIERIRKARDEDAKSTGA
jgi:hypothetical protein